MTDTERIKRLEQLLLAMKFNYYGREIYCEDVDGKNWFDMRDELMEAK
jgi:hypothetical protein